MKKCSKCGTILDDSKKKCYMCGADLSSSSSLNKLNSFDANIGATVSKGHDNVFSDNNKIKENAEIESIHENIFFKEPVKDKREFFQQEMNSLNSSKDNKQNKIQSSKNKNSSVKSDDKLNSLFKKKKNEPQEVASEKDKMKNERLEKQKEKERLVKERELQKQQKLEKEKELKEAELKLKKEREERLKLEKELKKREAEEKVKKDLQKVDTANVDEIKFADSEEKVSFDVKKIFTNTKVSSIMNIIVFLVFIVAIIVVCVHFLGNGGNKKVSLGSLKYTIPEEFKLESSDGYSKFYNHGDGCSIRVTYGTDKSEDSYVDEYLNGIKEHYQNQNNLLNRRETIKINNNVWESLVISQLPDDGIYAGIEGFIKYQYVAIVYQKNSYTIVYTNTENDNTCSAMFNEFVDTLEFK